MHEYQYHKKSEGDVLKVCIQLRLADIKTKYNLCILNCYCNWYHIGAHVAYLN